MSSAEQPVRFGAFRFDFRNHQLTRRGYPVRMAASQIRLLTLFLERPGQLITREDIARRLWTESAMVDVERGINTAINRLRAALRDNPAQPEFLETVIGLGYRFVATIEPEQVPAAAIDLAASTDLTAQAHRPPSPEPASTPQTFSSDAANDVPLKPQPPIARSAKMWAAIAAAVLLLATAGAAAWRHHQAHASPTLTTASPRAPFLPVTFNLPENAVTAEEMLPDGKGLAYADNSGISLHWFDGRPERLLAPMPDFAVTRISAIASGTDLLVSGIDHATSQHQVWDVPQQGAYLHRVATDADMAAASPDGKTFAVLSPDGSAVSIGTFADGRLRRLHASDDSRSYSFVLWSADGRRLLLSSGPAGPVHTPCPLTGQAQPPGPPTAVAADWTLEMVDAASGAVLDRIGGPRLNDGFLRADNSLTYVSNPADIGPGGRAELMSLAIDPASGRFLGNPQVERSLPGTCAWGLSEGAGRMSLVLTRTNQQVHVADFDGKTLTGLRRLTNSAYDAYPHSWTPDGRVVFETGSNGKLAIFEQAPTDTTAHTLAALPEDMAMPQTSPDGRWAMFLRMAGHPQHPNGIFRIPLAGGALEQVPTHGEIEEFHCPHDPHAPCILREAEGRERLTYYALDPVTGMGKLLATTPWEPNRLGDWSVSPDGKTVAAASHNSQHPGLHLIALENGRVTELPLPGHGELLGATWAVDRSGFFLESKSEKGYRLSFRNFAGHETTLRESPLLVWAVPSTDGRQVALPSPSTSTNVWSVEKK